MNDMEFYEWGVLAFILPVVIVLVAGPNITLFNYAMVCVFFLGIAILVQGIWAHEHNKLFLGLVIIMVFNFIVGKIAWTEKIGIKVPISAYEFASGLANYSGLNIATTSITTSGLNLITQIPAPVWAIGFLLVIIIGKRLH